MFEPWLATARSGWPELKIRSLQMKAGSFRPGVRRRGEKRAVTKPQKKGYSIVRLRGDSHVWKTVNVVIRDGDGGGAVSSGKTIGHVKSARAVALIQEDGTSLPAVVEVGAPLSATARSRNPSPLKSADAT